VPLLLMSQELGKSALNIMCEEKKQQTF